MNEKIDIVITWVDGSDKEWLLEKNKYSKVKVDETNAVQRYRDFDQLKYWFRGIEKYAPWFNKIYFVTCGQKPEWLNENNPKLVLVNHTDYIPHEFLPTFSSHPIELNFHRIENLSEKFIYFNDDMFLTDFVSPEDFFVNNKAVDNFVETTLVKVSDDYMFANILLNTMGIINDKFNKRDVIKKNKNKLFSLNNSLKGNFKNLIYNKSMYFSLFEYDHLPSPLFKSTLNKVWSEYNDRLYSTCLNKFRSDYDVNQYVFKWWNLCEGNFVPKNYKFGKCFTLYDDNSELINSIKTNKYKFICINDNNDFNDFESVKTNVNNAFEVILSEKSSFEK